MAKKSQPVALDFLSGATGSPSLSGMFSASVSEIEQARPIEVEKLLSNPYQPRARIEPEGLEELAGVIKAQGFQGVLVARPHPEQAGFYQITAGHRRREAAKQAGLTTIPTVIRELSDEEMVTIAITENIQREDLNPLEEGKIFLLMSEEMGYTQEQVAKEVGKTRGYVVNRLRVANAPADIQELVVAKPDSLRAVANLIKIKDEEERARLIAGMLEGKITTDDLPGFADKKAEPTETSARTNEYTRPATGEPDEYVQMRVATNKLVNALRNLKYYRRSLENRENVTDDEYQTLASIIDTVRELQQLLQMEG